MVSPLSQFACVEYNTRRRHMHLPGSLISLVSKSGMSDANLSINVGLRYLRNAEVLRGHRKGHLDDDC